MFENIDLLIVGAGPVGCVIAERAASQLGWQCLIVEKRSHIAGNCYDDYFENGVMIHRYGPHLFRTNHSELIDYLSRFTDWIPGNYIVKSFLNDHYFPIPINLETLELFYKRSFTSEEAKDFLESVREKIEAPQNSEEYVLSRIGRELYEAFYLDYTIKQWDRHPKELDASVCGRIPIRFDRNPSYVDQRFQVMPAQGFTAMFKRMINHPNISVLLEVDYRTLKPHIQPTKATVYCGAIDDYFDRCLGRLPWRSLDFEYKVYAEAYHQASCIVTYPKTFEYTRSVECKHLTGQQHPETVVSYEYSQSTGDPYYPIPNAENHRLYKQYEALAQEETFRNKVYFSGRLARYSYINTDEAIEMGLETFDTLKALSDG
jgi:UDP-galactopyranose mutase